MDIASALGKGSSVEVRSLDPAVLVQIRKHEFFQGLEAGDIETILPFFRLVILQPGEIVARQGVMTKEMYVLLEGNFEVIKSIGDPASADPANKNTDEFIIAKPMSGDVVGELSFFRDIPRGATIRNMTRSTALYIAPPQMKEMREKYPKITSIVLQNLLGYISDRVGKTSQAQVEILDSRLKVSQRNAKSNIFFSYIIGLLCIYNLTINLTSRWSTSPTTTSLVSTGMILFFFGVMVLLIQKSQLPFSMYGITWKNWKPSLVESVGWTVAIMAMMLGFKWALINFNPAYQEYSLIQFPKLEPKYIALNFILYGLHSPIQEFIVRGVLQGSLHNFLNGNNVKWRAIIISNALFTATHVHLFTGPLALVIFLPGLLWGWLYSRHQNLLGVSISHILIGWWGLFVLSFDTLL